MPPETCNDFSVYLAILAMFLTHPSLVTFVMAAMSLVELSRAAKARGAMQPSEVLCEIELVVPAAEELAEALISASVLGDDDFRELFGTAQKAGKGGNIKVNTCLQGEPGSSPLWTSPGYRHSTITGTKNTMRLVTSS